MNNTADIDNVSIPSRSNLERISLDGNPFFISKVDPGISKGLRKRLKFGQKWHREPEFMDIIESEVEIGDVVLDLGANLGYATYFLTKFVGASGTVFAVEPSPSNFMILRENIKVFDQSNIVISEDIAIGGSDGECDLHISEESNLNSFRETKHSRRKISVTVRTLDSYFAEKNAFPNFIKMDIEGAEVDALHGLNALLKEYPGQTIKILMELHPGLYESAKLKEEFVRLAGAGFHVKKIVSTGDKTGQFFRNLGYEPSIKYQSGTWTRFVFENVSIEHAISAAIFYDPSRKMLRPISDFLRNPLRVLQPYVSSPKVVRAILLERPAEKI